MCEGTGGGFLLLVQFRQITEMQTEIETEKMPRFIIRKRVGGLCTRNYRAAGYSLLSSRVGVTLGG